mmetsp:Transcript_118384/g.339823  ORF Transcript_118384/g.339823 Transcript_118384/m.339823 type:complete len:978 (-) Transcript_118384:24-2957(-)
MLVCLRRTTAAAALRVATTSGDALRRLGLGSPHAPDSFHAWGGGASRCTSALIRRRRRAYHRALADPHASPAKVRKLRERAAVPTIDLLRNVAENKIGKAVTMPERKNLWYDLRYKKYAPVFLGQVKPKMKFWTAALEEAQLPVPRLPEVAFCGRSNSGKSTLVNYLSGNHSAHVKRTPGSTTELVFWQIGKPASLCLVDLPGYGFAEAPEERRLQWTEFTLWYVRSRRNLRRVFLLIDARAGIKPVDKEMIAYLERHSVPWQIVVTKCDKVIKKAVAKRITIMQEDLAGYRKMAGDPIPISALKRKGMEALREVLDGMQVRKEILKEGIRKRIYDLLEIKRLKRIERAQKRKEAKEAKKLADAEAAAAAQAFGVGDSEAQMGEATAATARSNVAMHPDLHRVLDDWGFGPDGGGAASSGGGGRTGQDDEELAQEPRPFVTEAHYSLEDRDSVRAQRFAENLFPDFRADSLGIPSGGAAVSMDAFGGGRVLADRPAATSLVAGAGFAEGTSAFLGAATAADDGAAAEAPFPFRSNPQAGGGDGFRGSTGSGAGGLGWRMRHPHASAPSLGPRLTEEWERGQADDASDSDGEDEDPHDSVLPSVMRFDPSPPSVSLHARGDGFSSPRRQMAAAGLFGGASKAASASSATPQGRRDASEGPTQSPFPGFQKAPAYSPGSPAASGGGRDRDEARRVVGLRPEWVRPAAPVQMYDRDDFASPEDRAAAVRPFSPPAPSRESQGTLLAEARKRFEREWAMELEDVDEVRAVAADSLRAAAGGPRGHDAATALAVAGRQASSDSSGARAGSQNNVAGGRGSSRMQQRRIDKTGAKAGYITKEGSKPLPRGMGLWRVLGRPPGRVLKKKFEHDAARVLGLVDHKGRKVNKGAGLTYKEAREDWMRWYKRNKFRHPDKVSSAPSPRREDVEADYEERQFRRRVGRFGGGAARLLQKQRRAGSHVGKGYGQEEPGDQPGRGPSGDV